MSEAEADGGGSNPFRLKLRLNVRTIPVVRNVHTDVLPGLANYIVVTMGGRMKQFEAAIPHDGIIDINHVFEPIVVGSNYHDQAKLGDLPPSDAMRLSGLDYYGNGSDTRIKSHCIIWLYLRRYERKVVWGQEVDSTGNPPVKDAYVCEVPKYIPILEDDDARYFECQGDEIKRGPFTPILRCHLIGSAAIDIAQVCSATAKRTAEVLKNLQVVQAAGAVEISQGVSVVEEEGEDAPDPPYTFRCTHNFCKTYSLVEIMPLKSTESDGYGPDKIEESVEVLKAGIEAYKKEEDEARKNERDPDHSNHGYMPSELIAMCKCNEVVRLQQTLMQCVSVAKLQARGLDVSDEMGVQFMSGSTYLQLQGFSVCFTDMSDIVRIRGAELPFSLVMMHAYAAILGHGFTPEQVCKMSRDEDAEDLFEIYLSIITGEMMDSKHAEYYSDYCLHGVEEATEDDMRENVQPNPLNPDTAGELWFYRKREGKVIRYRLKMTEDQRQVCTCEGLHEGMMQDDCETDAAFEMTEQKTCQAIKAKLVRDDILTAGWTQPDDDDDAAAKKREHHKSNAALFLGKLKSMLENESKYQNLINTMLGTHRPVGDNVWSASVHLVMAVANILRQFEFSLDLCVGTANAAAVGAAAQLSGHCYCGAEATHIATGLPFRRTVEGTRWVLQKRRHLVRTGDGADMMTEDQINKLNEISSILMEMTKSGKTNPLFDTGMALVQMREGGGGFYKHTYVRGNKILMRRMPGGKLVLGAPIDMVMSTEARSVAESENDTVQEVDSGSSSSEPGKLNTMEVKYELVCTHLRESVGSKIDAATIAKTIRRMARETIVPPWSKAKWLRTLNNFNGLETLYTQSGDKAGLSIRSSRRVRFVFTHQTGTKMTNDEKNDLKYTILGVLNSPDPRAPVMAKHNERLERVDFDSKKVNPKFRFDETDANRHLKHLANKVRVERIFTSMNSLVTVCTVAVDEIETIHAAAMGWVTVIAAANKAKSDAIKKPVILVGKEEQD